MDEKILVVFNPTSGRGKALKILPKVLAYLQLNGLEFKTFETLANRENSLAEITEELSNGITSVIVIGGDGTINLVANALVNSQIPLGIIPAGTGNDYVKMLHIGSSLKQQIETSVFGKTIKVDVGKCNDRIFVNGIGIGFDGQIAENMINDKSWLRGHFKYYYHVLKILAFFKSIRLTVMIDGSTTTKNYFLLTIAKGITFGGGFRLVPHGKLDSGLLAICEIAPLAPIKRFLNLIRLEKGTHDQLNEVTLSTATTIHITENKTAKAHIDGEFIGSPPFEISVLKEALLIRTGQI
jgi:diacylglycerol kinase (ATP)